MAFFISKQIRQFLIRVIQIAIIIFFCDLGIGSLMKFYYFRQKSGQSYLTTRALDSISADILIFGSSRAIHHYVPKVFEDSLRCTVFNVGRDGSFILYNYAIFKAITKRYHPKIIIFDISPEEIIRETTTYERLSNLLPYYQDYPEIRNTLNLRGPFEMIKRISSIYPYNSTLLSIIKGNLTYFKTNNSETNGYIPIFKILQNKKIDTINIDRLNTDIIIDENKIAAIKDIIADCKQKGINIIFVQSPMFTIKNDYCFNPVFSKLCFDYNVRYFNLINQPLFIKQPDYFADKNHLNNDGALLFSKMLINKIRQSI